MELKHSIIKRQKYEHLSLSDRIKLEALIGIKKSVKEIAKILGRDKSTIYREIKRGKILRLQTDLSEKEMYRANVGHAEYKRLGKNKERSLKIGKDHRLEEYIRKRLLEDRYSPDAIIGEIRVRELKFERTISTKTLYNYIEKGIFSGISNKDLWEKRKRKKRGYNSIVRMSYTNRLGRSIEDRPKKIDTREEYGHWEGDSVKGPLQTKASLVTLTERKSREQIIVKVNRSTQEAIREAIDGLEKKYGGMFRAKFKSITFDNGIEFVNWKSIEVSSLIKGMRRTRVYFAHAYASWERGTNENQNRMIRRFIPKGQNIAVVSEERVQEIQDWMNNYPRKILGYKTANQVAQENLQKTVKSFDFVAL
ncbi:MAG TPA: IS30 family transposase [Candidatus Omnitrophota bacterium]|nr:IS30 family transposase [Candidatus Omnitrophota bacterium]